MINDNWIEIFKHMDDGKSYKNILETNKLFYYLMTTHYSHKKVILCNPLTTLLKIYPDKTWDWAMLSCNKKYKIRLYFIPPFSMAMGMDISKSKHYDGNGFTT